MFLTLWVALRTFSSPWPPREEVPTLEEDDGFCLAEQVAIMRYLANKSAIPERLRKFKRTMSHQHSDC